MPTMQVVPWILATLVALERLLHYRNRGTGAAWFSLAFILAAMGAVVLLVTVPPSLLARVVLGVAALATAVTGGLYAHPVVEANTKGHEMSATQT
jgi:hypothetical protein